MKAVKVTPKLLVARMEVAKVAQLIGLSCNCGTNYMLCRGLARVWVESDKIVPKIRLSPKFGTCAGGNSENGAGNIFRALQRMQSGPTMAESSEGPLKISDC